MKNNIEEQLELPCGSLLSNRLCKTAMTEGLSDELNRSTDELCTLMKNGARVALAYSLQEMYKSIEDIWREQET